MRGELQDVNHNIFNYSVARGLFFTGNEAYVVEVYEGGNTEEFGVVLTGAEEKIAETVYNQPQINGEGINESLSMRSDDPELPETDEELEAFARYVLQGDVEEGLEYQDHANLKTSTTELSTTSIALEKPKVYML